jgi:hypothetical protein
MRTVRPHCPAMCAKRLWDTNTTCFRSRVHSERGDAAGGHRLRHPGTRKMVYTRPGRRCRTASCSAASRACFPGCQGQCGLPWCCAHRHAQTLLDRLMHGLCLECTTRTQRGCAAVRQPVAVGAFDKQLPLPVWRRKQPPVHAGRSARVAVIVSRLPGSTHAACHCARLPEKWSTPRKL